MMEKWQDLKKFLYQKKEQLSNKGRVKLFLSPYDVPSAFRVGKSDSCELFIEFRYIQLVEPIELISDKENNHVDLEVGKKSGRIYKVILNNLPDNHEINIELSVDEVKHALQKLTQNNNKFNKEKYDPALQATRDVLANVSHGAYVN